MITLTEKAISRVKEFAEAEGLRPSIRVFVKGGGCGGLQQDMHLEDFTTDMDEILEQDGVKVIVDCFSIHYLNNVVVDFIDSEFAKGFKFIMKDEKTVSCGCGSSFGYK